MLDHLGLSKRGFKPGLSDAFAEVHHDQVGGAFLGQLVSDGCAGRLDAVRLTGLRIVINALKTGQGVELLPVSFKKSPSLIAFGQQLFDRLILLVDNAEQVLSGVLGIAHPENITLSAQSLNRLLKRLGASSVYLTVCWIALCPK